MSVVGIDPSLTACGIAVLNRGPVSRTEIADLRAVGRRGHDGASYADRSDRIVAQTRYVLRCIPTDAELVVIEDMPQGIRSMPSLGDRWALWWGLYSALRSRKTPVAVCNPATRAKWATGSGRADKADVLAAVRDQWPHNTIRSDNEADALTMASMGALHLGWSLPFEIKDRHHAGLEVVAWPKEEIAR